MASNQKFQRFTCKSQLAYYVCSFACTTSLTSEHNLIIQNFELHKFMRNGQKDHKTM